MSLPRYSVGPDRLHSEPLTPTPEKSKMAEIAESVEHFDPAQLEYFTKLIDERVEAALKRRDDDRRAALDKFKKSIGYATAIRSPLSNTEGTK